jgi:hypothetical protein
VKASDVMNAVDSTSVCVFGSSLKWPQGLYYRRELSLPGGRDARVPPQGD